MRLQNDTSLTEFNPPCPLSTSITEVLPAGAALVCSSSLLESSLLELSLLAFVFFADGPLAASAQFGGTFRFFDSGDLFKNEASFSDIDHNLLK